MQAILTTHAMHLRAVHITLCVLLSTFQILLAFPIAPIAHILITAVKHAP